MGVQVALELYRLAPERVKGLVLICGSYKNPFLSLPLFSEKMATALTDLFRRFPEIPEKAFHILMNFPPVLSLLQGLGTISPKARRDRLLEILKEMGGLDFARYFTLLDRLKEHSAEDLLSGISVPVLLVAGEKDLMIPPELAEDFKERIPKGELLLVPGGTHYAPVEEPLLIARTIESWIARNRLA
jgi:pimeloyl-ACP methyl ester carboxylesterase